MASSLSLPVQEAFEAAKRDFYQNLKNANDYDFSSFTSITDVYDTTEKIQTKQAKTGSLRYLNRIKPYLDVLCQYIGVLDTFSQVKADVTSLIWGPIKFLLQISSTLIKSYDKIIDLMGQIGDRLPKFTRYAELFKSNGQIQHLLGVFFKDILDFHVTSLNFFKLKKWNLFFESLWPKYGNKITIIMTNIERHASLMVGEVTLTDITNAQEAREQALEKYRRDQEFQRRQDFASVRQALSPHLYDDDLDVFRKNRCQNSGDWLESHEKFCEWLSPSGSPRLFWLKGIPGAGKTILSSHIIDKARALDRSNVFAFLSHKDPCITTIKIFQSFIFQLLLDNPHLQPVLSAEYFVNPRKVSSDTKYVRNLLVDLIQALDITYVVVDGLDEIDQTERQILLKDLLEVNRDTSNMKLLVSSRIERDIVRLLPTDVEAGQVNDRNINDIKAYVQERTSLWLISSDFDVEASVEIKKLLNPLASKSNGMILYARLIMDSLCFLCSLEEIIGELSTLPIGLDQAYGRILERINLRLTDRNRKQAKRILAWIGCSKIPMRKREIEAALSIRKKDATFLKTQRLFLDIAGLCGPIVEIRNEMVQFVHFTAKEYVFGPQSKTFVKPFEAHLDISETCVRYLRFECFEFQDPSGIQASILSGDYILFSYAATQWIHQFLHCAQRTNDLEELKDLCNDVEHLINKWDNTNYNGASRCPRGNIMEFKMLQEKWPEIFEALIPEKSFWKFEAPFWSLKDDTIDCMKSPLSIFAVYMEFHCQLDLLLCQGKHHEPGCYCQELQNSYGQRVFKCDRFGCRFHQLGFETRRERDTHVKAHDRSFKCPETACQFSDIGFKSETALRQHVDQFHRERFVIQSTSQIFNDMEPKQLESLLVDSVLANEIGYVRHFLGGASDEETSNEAYLTALRSSSVAMVELFLHSGKNIDEAQRSQHSYVPLIEAVRHINFEVAKFLLSRGCDLHKKDTSPTENNDWRALDLVMRIYNPDSSLEFVTLLLDHGVDLSMRKVNLCALISSNIKNCLPVIQMLDIFKSTARNGDGFNDVLEAVGERNYSIEIAEYLLKNGANINTKGSNSRPRGASPLHLAARKSSLNAAKFVKFLLESGADPFLKVRDRLPGDQYGAQKISKWLGITWDELVESTVSARAK